MKRSCLKVAAWFLALVPLTLPAQSTGEVTGTVADPSHSIVLNVELRLTNTSTGAATTTRTNADGIFRFTNLLPGGYEMTATATGFATSKISGIAVDVSRTTRVDVNLQLITTQQQVNVMAGEQLLDLDNGAKGQIIGSSQVDSLPLERALDEIPRTGGLGGAIHPREPPPEVLPIAVHHGVHRLRIPLFHNL